MTLDSYDRKILTALQADGALTNGALSELVNLSASQCSRRRSALEAAGLIKGYHARLDAQKLGFSLRAFVRVSIRSHGGADHAAFCKWLERQPAVHAAFTTSGTADYMLEVRVRDLDAFADFVHDHLTVQPEVAQVQSDFVLKTLKDGRAFDLSEG